MRQPSCVTSFQTMATVGSVIAGFAFSGMMMRPLKRYDNYRYAYAPLAFNMAAAFTFCGGLLTLLYATFLSIRAKKLSLVGGPTAMEVAVKQCRGELYFIMCVSLNQHVDLV